MKKIIAIAAMLCLFGTGYSQDKYSEEFGKITQYELIMETYERDSDAEAVVIYDSGEYYFQAEERRGFLLHMTRKIKIKILTSAGLPYANFEIPYYKDNYDWESVEDIEAATYNMENNRLTKTELNPKNIYEEKISEKIRIKKIALSNVREGSVIEIRYKISTPYYFNMRNWDFQKKIPVVHSTLRYRAIPFYEYTYLLKGTNKFDEFSANARNDEIRIGQVVYKEMIYVFGMRNIPAFRDEAFITSEKDYMIGINFQISKLHHPSGVTKNIVSTWPAMCDDFLKDEKFGKYIKDSEKEASKLLPALGIEGKPQLEQTRRIAEYVKTMYKWNGQQSKYISNKLSEFLKQKTGNAAEINLFLIGLLKAARIDVNPIVLSTRENGAVNKDHHPFQQFFNYVIAKVNVDGKTYYIDGTESLLYFSEVPDRCMNIQGLVVKPKSEEWAIISQKIPALTQKIFDIKVAPEMNTLEVNAQYTSTGYNAYIFRSIYIGKEENLSKYLKDKNNIDIKKGIDVAEANELNKPFTFSFRFDTQAEGSSEKLFINPFCSLAASENPFKQNSRTLPVDLVYIRSEIYNSTIEIPAGYKVEHLPEPFLANNNLLKVNYTVSHVDNKIEITAGYSFTKEVYDAGNYNGLKMVYADMIKRFSEMVVLAKE